MIIETSNGKVNIFPLFCEVTGEQIGWKTNNNHPAYISFQVVSQSGQISNENKKLIKSIITF